LKAKKEEMERRRRGGEEGQGVKDPDSRACRLIKKKKEGRLRRQKEILKVMVIPKPLLGDKQGGGGGGGKMNAMVILFLCLKTYNEEAERRRRKQGRRPRGRRSWYSCLEVRSLEEEAQDDKVNGDPYTCAWRQRMRRRGGGGGSRMRWRRRWWWRQCIPCPGWNDHVLGWLPQIKALHYFFPIKFFINRKTISTMFCFL
jgi:hypothetical protein